MFGKKHRTLQVKIENIIAQGAVFRGGLSFPAGVHVNGTVVGPVMAEGMGSAVLVGPHGRIEGCVTSETVIVAGTIEGDIRCAHVVVKNGAFVTGTIFAASLEIEKGATIAGSCQSHPGYSPFAAPITPAVNDEMLDDQQLHQAS